MKLSKTFITSPIDGIVTKQDAKVGSIVAANAPLVTVIGLNNLQIESYIPEKNIPLIKVGNEAEIVLDAYGDESIFRASIISIDPAETIKDGVSTYRVKFRFLTKDPRIKSGMTANVLITTNKKSNVISVPQGVVIRKGGEKFVKVREGNEIIERKVETGGISSLGGIEIVSGLKDGDTVILELAE